MLRLLKRQLRRFLEHRGCVLLYKGQVEPDFLADLTNDEKVIIAATAERTMLQPHNVAQLCRCIEYIVRHNIPGAIVECGVWRGGAVLAILRTLLRLGVTDREVFLFDTFAGMTAPTEHDVSWRGECATSAHAARGGYSGGSDWARASLEDVKDGVMSVGYPAERIRFVQGRVEDTIPTQAPEQLSLMRLDTDWYESTKHELIHLYPRLSHGGVIIIDDYGAWAGSRRATDEYIAETGARLLLVRSDMTVRYAVKVDA
ncbi:macrocin O-methyltransferase [candidate division WS5 bacterium]|uniref:Macrocin O-methyltransferase n=1 Tax=candidate division WS5 bacterium TaxID=2093353 RepID=A0A419DAL6_9BACT|nr:MAG: macrocin O-methyltransferase [candidate division WS5 bacterium]